MSFTEHSSAPVPPSDDVTAGSSFVAAVLIVAGLAAFALGDVWHEWVAEIVPHRFLSRTSGTTSFYGGFRDRGSDIAFGTSLLLLAAGFTMVISPRVNWASWVDRRTWSQRLGPATGRTEIAIVAGGFVLLSGFLTWLGTPLNGRNNHTYIHWVRNVFGEDPLDLYVLPRLPHRLFYYQPGVLVFLISLTTLGLLWVIARQLKFGPLLSGALASSFFLAGVVVFFVNADEDVSLNFLVTIAVIASFSARRSLWFGLTVVLAVATREQWTTLALVAPLALVPHIVADVRSAVASGQAPVTSVWASRDVRFLVQAAAFAAPLFVVYLVVAEVIGTRAFFIDGAIFRLDPAFERHSPILVDGFKISAFSGAYVGRVFWILAPASVGLIIVGFGVLKRMSRNQLSLFLFCALAIVVNVILLEAKPLTHPQMRYLAYVAPFVAVGSWVTYAALRAASPAGHPRRALLFVIVLLAPLTSPFDGLDKRSFIIDQPGMSMMSDARDIASLRGNRTVLIEDGSDYKFRENLVGYVFQLERSDFAPLQGSPPAESIAVYFTDLDSHNPDLVLWRGEDAVVVRGSS